MKHCNLFFLFFMFLFIFSSHVHADNNKNSWRFDHVTIAVDNLDEAMYDFTKLGFTVIKGSKSTNGFSKNAIIPFLDGSYIELYTPIKSNLIARLVTLKKHHKLSIFTNNIDAFDAYLMSYLINSQGFAGFAISKAKTMNLYETIIDLSNLGLSYVGPIPFYQVMADHRNVAWDVIVPESKFLPFIITDETPHIWRKGIRFPPTHKNWVTGIASITIAVYELEKPINDYEMLLNTKPIEDPPFSAPENVRIAAFKIGSTYIVLAQPTDTQSPLYAFLKKHGVGIYHMSLYTADKAYVGKLDTGLTHNAGIKLILKP